MNKVVSLNILMNLFFGAIFVLLNNWALQNSLEETFISLSLIFGIMVVVGNALYVSVFCKK